MIGSHSQPNVPRGLPLCIVAWRVNSQVTQTHQTHEAPCHTTPMHTTWLALQQTLQRLDIDCVALAAPRCATYCACASKTPPHTGNEQLTKTNQSHETLRQCMQKWPGSDSCWKWVGNPKCQTCTKQCAQAYKTLPRTRQIHCWQMRFVGGEGVYYINME